MTTLEILTKARVHLNRPGMWIRGWGRVGAGQDGKTCALGAVRLAAGLPSNPHGANWNNDAEKAANALAAVIGGSVVGYNDEHDQRCVLAMFDAAIEREQAAPK